MRLDTFLKNARAGCSDAVLSAETRRWGHRRYSFAACLLAVTLWGVSPARAQTSPLLNSGIRPQLLRDVGIDQKLNEQVPLDLPFLDEAGKSVRLGSYFGKRPVVLALVYFECPMLCTQVLNGLLRSLQNLNLDAGRQFAVLTVSINPRETPDLALAKQKIYTEIYGRSGASAGWHFLTGQQPAIEQLAKSVGFRYAYDPVSGQYAHATAIMVLTPEGKISRYFYGIEYPSRDLRLGLVEASAGKIGSPVDQVLLFCYHYDPATGKYGLVISRIVRAAGLGTALALGLFMFLMFRRERYA